MGYAYYVLPDGREAGYGVEAQCDEPGCNEMIDRGLGYLCGRNPDFGDMDEFHCGKYFCGKHLYVRGQCRDCGDREDAAEGTMGASE